MDQGPQRPAAGILADAVQGVVEVLERGLRLGRKVVGHGADEPRGELIWLALDELGGAGDRLVVAPGPRALDGGAILWARRKRRGILSDGGGRDAAGKQERGEQDGEHSKHLVGDLPPPIIYIERGSVKFSGRPRAAR